MLGYDLVHQMYKRMDNESVGLWAIMSLVLIGAAVPTSPSFM